MTLEQLEARSGVPVGTISALEVRDSMRSSYALPLAKALGLSLEELMDQPGDVAPKQPNGSPDVPVSWPFSEVSPDEWKMLPKGERKEVEVLIRAKLDKIGAKRRAA
ncbi:transcriptional regulator with XRE-family HTH domain [Kerstersia gyiorum]|nr:transcriptional regulator with XRE-family HTH domain [Kerstersia gyiorum]MCP1823938.1 transcriptional regulator with XRE-family HTH domain [Kerstersia gyiorum]MCP1827379.1 transcriptional regulator with XRE-family HTH domain [Kerstersia gyiorum]